MKGVIFAQNFKMVERKEVLMVNCLATADDLPIFQRLFLLLFFEFLINCWIWEPDTVKVLEIISDYDITHDVEINKQYSCVNFFG